MRFMPSCPVSSIRPMKGETYVAPAFAAISACEAEKISVTLVSTPSSVKTLVAASPSGVQGILMITFEGNSAFNWRACSNIPGVSIAVTSAEIGPEQIPAISPTTSLKSRPLFFISDGLVVTPSRIPQAAISRISSTSAVSRKNSMHLR